MRDTKGRAHQTRNICIHRHMIHVAYLCVILKHRIELPCLPIKHASRPNVCPGVSLEQTMKNPKSTHAYVSTPCSTPHTFGVPRSTKPCLVSHQVELAPRLPYNDGTTTIASAHSSRTDRKGQGQKPADGPSQCTFTPTPALHNDHNEQWVA